jgi:UDP-N-acetylmuramate dehydrogenase
MQIRHNFSLKNFNTFGIDACAKSFLSISNNEQLKEILQQKNDIFVLSGGSNVLFTKDIDKLVVHINTKGISHESINENEVLVSSQAGENWHEFVLYCISKNFGGLENLSLIPGNVGTSPIQNIGAYGAEVKDTITELEAIEIKTGKIRVFKNDECEFGYRNSIFKHRYKNKYIILKVTYKLTKKTHNLNYSYGAIQSELDKQSLTTPTIKDISDAIIKIRNSKLPNPDEIGNSGSFFKNPVVNSSVFNALKQKHPNIPCYVISEKQVKIPAGWLIEESGFKGKRFGETGVHKNQALVLINYGNATGKEVSSLAKKIQNTVLKNFKILLEVEVNIIA